MKVKIVILILSLIGCSSTSTSDSQVPVWVTSPYELCNAQNDICGVGEGKNLKDADVTAKTEIASFFRAQLSSNLVSTQATFQSENMSTILQQSQSESFSQVLNSQVNEIVEGVEVIQRYIFKEREFYSLARLKKSVLEDLIRNKLNDIDQRRDTLLEKRARVAIFSLRNLLIERQGHERLLLTMDRPLMGGSKSNEWWQQSLAMMRSPSDVYLQFEGESIDQDWTDVFKSAIAQSGHHLIADPKSAKFLIKSRFKLLPEPINVDGFLKARVQWQASAFDLEKGSRVTGALDEVVEVTGRNKEQLWHRAKDTFKSQLLEKIHLLNI